MAREQYDVVAIGNAIVDVLARVEDAFLVEHQIAKGAMTLIEEERADALLHLFHDPVEAAGGSAANTLTGVASFGARGAYIGKVAHDRLGEVFVREFRAAGVDFDTPWLEDGPGTARCLIAVTGDGQRSMSTYLGASSLLEAGDVDRDLIAAGKILFLEGYLFDRPEAKAAFVRGAEIAAAAGRKTALTLSDTFCVERHREAFRHLVRHHVDVLFANENELLALYQTRDFDAAMAMVREDCHLAAVTRSAKGSIVAANGETYVQLAEPVDRVIDTTGAGDLYAAGFLVGLAREREPADCARLGSIAAAEVISHMGPRPETSLQELAEAAGAA